MTKNEFLANLKKQADRADAYHSRKGRIRRLVIIGILVIGSAVSVLIGMSSTKSGKTKMYDAYIEDHSAINYEYLNYLDTFDIWNNTDIGNDVNNLLSGGKVYSRSDLSILPDNEGNYSIIKNGSSIVSLGQGISYINVVEKTVFYREDSTRNLLAVKIGSAQPKVLVKGNVGEVFAYGGRIYYIDIKSGSLMSVDPNGKDKQTVYQYPINTFAVCGSNIFVLDNNKRFGICHISEDGTGSFSSSVTNVERFFIDGEIYAESDETIFKFEPNGSNAEAIYQPENPDMRLAGVSDSVVFVQEAGKLYALVNGDKKLLVNEKHELYQSILFVGSDQYYVVATKDSQKALAINELLKVSCTKSEAEGNG